MGQPLGPKGPSPSGSQKKVSGNNNSLGSVGKNVSKAYEGDFLSLFSHGQKPGASRDEVINFQNARKAEYEKLYKIGNSNDTQKNQSFNNVQTRENITTLNQMLELLRSVGVSDFKKVDQKDSSQRLKEFGVISEQRLGMPKILELIRSDKTISSDSSAFLNNRTSNEKDAELLRPSVEGVLEIVKKAIVTKQVGFTVDQFDKLKSHLKDVNNLDFDYKDNNLMTELARLIVLVNDTLLTEKINEYDPNQLEKTGHVIKRTPQQQLLHHCQSIANPTGARSSEPKFKAFLENRNDESESKIKTTDDLTRKIISTNPGVLNVRSYEFAPDETNVEKLEFINNPLDEDSKSILQKIIHIIDFKASFGENDRTDKELNELITNVQKSLIEYGNSIDSTEKLHAYLELKTYFEFSESQAVSRGVSVLKFITDAAIKIGQIFTGSPQEHVGDVLGTVNNIEPQQKITYDFETFKINLLDQLYDVFGENSYFQKMINEQKGFLTQLASCNYANGELQASPDFDGSVADKIFLSSFIDAWNNTREIVAGEAHLSSAVLNSLLLDRASNELEPLFDYFDEILAMNGFEDYLKKDKKPPNEVINNEGQNLVDFLELNNISQAAFMTFRSACNDLKDLKSKQEFLDSDKSKLATIEKELELLNDEKSIKRFIIKNSPTYILKTLIKQTLLNYLPTEPHNYGEESVSGKSYF